MFRNLGFGEKVGFFLENPELLLIFAAETTKNQTYENKKGINDIGTSGCGGQRNGTDTVSRQGSERGERTREVGYDEELGQAHRHVYLTRGKDGV